MGNNSHDALRFGGQMAEEALLVFVQAVMVPPSDFWAAPLLGDDKVACPSSATVFE
jgi:hypothetical protein